MWFTIEAEGECPHKTRKKRLTMNYEYAGSTFPTAIDATSMCIATFYTGTWNNSADEGLGYMLDAQDVLEAFVNGGHEDEIAGMIREDLGDWDLPEYADDYVVCEAWLDAVRALVCEADDTDNAKAMGDFLLFL